MIEEENYSKSEKHFRKPRSKSCEKEGDVPWGSASGNAKSRIDEKFGKENGH